MTTGALTFLDPWFLLAGPVAVGLALWARRRRAAALPVAMASGLLDGLPRTLRQRLAWLPAVAWCLAATALAVALARPVTRELLPLRSQGRDILLVLDVSSSMNERDVDRMRRKRRVEAVREQALAFAAQRTQDRVGLITFARYPDLRCPPTLDERALAAFLRPVDTVVPDGPEDGTAIGAALARATQVLGRATGASRLAVLLSDGDETVGEIDPLDAARLAHDEGVRVYTIGFGDLRRVLGGYYEPKFEALQGIAETTGARFFRARSEADLAGVYAAIDELETSELEDPRYRTDDRFAAPLAVAGLLALLALGFELGVVRRCPA
ncbi:MAG: VWA domain-containing protein [Planctomycetes bacterium]|nr:VWA domain-containing protein [Planctomycetota bacterium]